MSATRQSKHKPKPKYLQLANEMSARIRSGELPPGVRLPSNRQLTRQLNLSTTTVVSAMDELKSRGLIKKVQGSGTYVSQDASRQNKTLRIGFFMEKTSPYARRTLTALIEILDETCDLIPLARDVEQFENTVREYQLDGALVMNSNIDLAAYSKLSMNGIPSVLLSSIPEEQPDSGIGYSNSRIISDAIDYLTSLGHKKIGFLIHGLESSVYKLRYDAFYKAMWDKQLPVNPQWILAERFKNEKLEEYLSAADRPTAIIFGSCYVLPILCDTIKKLKIDVPEHVSILSIDENEDAADYLPRISCLRIDVNTIARAGLNHILNKIRGKEVTPASECNYELIDAGSCKNISNHPKDS